MRTDNEKIQYCSQCFSEMGLIIAPRSNVVCDDCKKMEAENTRRKKVLANEYKGKSYMVWTDPSDCPFNRGARFADLEVQYMLESGALGVGTVLRKPTRKNNNHSYLTVVRDKQKMKLRNSYPNEYKNRE